jgi:glutamine amidotransferase
MGWNRVALKDPEHPLFKGISPEAEFYFVHSYFPAPDDAFVLGTTQYGLEFCSFHGREGLWATQFHPEKSGSAGLKLLQNFYNWCQSA